MPTFSEDMDSFFKSEKLTVDQQRPWLKRVQTCARSGRLTQTCNCSEFIKCGVLDNADGEWFTYESDYSIDKVIWDATAPLQSRWYGRNGSVEVKVPGKGSSKGCSKGK